MQRSDLLDFDAGAEFHLIPGDGRPAGAPGDRGVDLELVQNRGDRIDHLVIGRTPPLGRITSYQQVQWRQRVGAVHYPVDRLRRRLGSTAFRISYGRISRAGIPGYRGRLLTPGLDRFGEAPGRGSRIIEWVIVMRRAGGTRSTRPKRLSGGPAGAQALSGFVRKGRGHTPDDTGAERAAVVVLVVIIVVVPVAVIPVAVIPVAVIPVAVAAAGGEHGMQRRGHLPDGGSGDQQHPEPDRADQQWGRDPRRQSVRQRPADDESDEATGALPVDRPGRRSRPQVPQSEYRQADHRRTENQSRAGFRVGLCAHQHQSRRGDQKRKQDHRCPDEGAQNRVDPGPDRTGGVKPARCGDDHRKRQ